MEFLRIKFPPDIVCEILSFTGGVKYRNGEYMIQISKQDRRYAILDRIPRPIPTNQDGRDYFMRFIRFSNDAHSLRITIRWIYENDRFWYAALFEDYNYYIEYIFSKTRFREPSACGDNIRQTTRRIPDRNTYYIYRRF